VKAAADTVPDLDGALATILAWDEARVERLREVVFRLRADHRPRCSSWRAALLELEQLAVDLALRERAAGERDDVERALLHVLLPTALRECMRANLFD
jgi:hypothetical protein